MSAREVANLFTNTRSPLSQGAITKSEIFKTHPYWGKMTTRGNLVTLVLIITLGCSHAYVGRIINVKILLGIMI